MSKTGLLVYISAKRKKYKNTNKFCGREKVRQTDLNYFYFAFMLFMLCLCLYTYKISYNDDQFAQDV